MFLHFSGIGTMTNKVDQDFDSSDESSSSVDTQEAFLEMLGLKDNPTEITEMENEIEDWRFGHGEYSSPASVYSVIQFPNQCSRHGYQSRDCFGLILDNIMDEEKCRLLIDLAEASGFRYIREATHYAPDGSSYTVQLQNPNPHKLSAIDTNHYVDISDDYTNSDPFHNNKVETFDDGLYPSISPKSTLNHTATNLLDSLYQSIYTHIISSKSFCKFIEREKCGPPMGLNPRIRVLKYDAKDNDSFQPHFDATTIVQNGKKRSLVTVLLYLNSGQGIDFQGGNTVFTNYTPDMFIAGNKYQAHRKALQNPKSSMKNYTEVLPIMGRVVLFEHDMFHSGEPLEWGTKYILRTDILFRDDSEDQAKMTTEKNTVKLNERLLENRLDENEPTYSKRLLISDICSDLNLSQKDCQTLRDIGLYECTCDAFLSPGVTALSVILQDHGMDRATVQKLIQTVVLNKT